MTNRFPGMDVDSDWDVAECTECGGELDDNNDGDVVSGTCKKCRQMMEQG